MYLSKIFTGFVLLLFFLIQPVAAMGQEVRPSQITGPCDSDHTDPDVEILKVIARKLNLCLNLVRTPFKRSLVMMQKGELDITAGLLKSPRREAYIHFVSPPYKTHSDTVFFISRDNPLMITTYDDLVSLRIGTTLGSLYFPRFDRDSSLIKETVPETEFNLKKLLAGRIDTVIAAESVGIEKSYRMGLSRQIRMADFRFSNEKYVYIGLSKKSGILQRVPRIEQIIGEMIRDGEIAEAFRTYYILRGLPVPAH